ncbi:MAG: hypothetical protein JWQ43_1435 [Glaciihabitans sp.]|nr:hypothetical protein [Glaciihabitans sp.]
MRIRMLRLVASYEKGDAAPLSRAAASRDSTLIRVTEEWTWAGLAK